MSVTIRELMTTREAAAYLNVSESFLESRRQCGLSPTYIKMGSLVRYRVCDIEIFLAECSVVGNEDSRVERLEAFMDDSAYVLEVIE